MNASYINIRLAILLSLLLSEPLALFISNHGISTAPFLYLSYHRVFLVSHPQTGALAARPIHQSRSCECLENICCLQTRHLYAWIFHPLFYINKVWVISYHHTDLNVVMLSNPYRAVLYRPLGLRLEWFLLTVSKYAKEKCPSQFS